MAPIPKSAAASSDRVRALVLLVEVAAGALLLGVAVVVEVAAAAQLLQLAEVGLVVAALELDMVLALLLGRLVAVLRQMDLALCPLCLALCLLRLLWRVSRCDRQIQGSPASLQRGLDRLSSF